MGDISEDEEYVYNYGSFNDLSDSEEKLFTDSDSGDSDRDTPPYCSSQ